MVLRTSVSRRVCWAALASLTVVVATIGQPALGAEGVVKKAMTKRGHRPYYEQVITIEQRGKIDKIQAEYEPKIAALQAQLKAVKKERDDKIAAILTPEQKKQVEEAKAKKTPAAPDMPVKPEPTNPVAPPVPPTEPQPSK